MRRYSFASSHLTAPDALSPSFHLGDVRMAKGETHYRLPPATESVDLVLTELVIETKHVLEECNLGRTSSLVVVTDLECPGFDLRTTVYRGSIEGSKNETSFADVRICSIPAAVVAEGFTVKLSLVALDPVVTSPAGCTTRGGILATWESVVPPRNRVSPFPTEESPNEPAIWRLAIDVDDPDDLDRPVRAAVRLYVDSTRLESLFGVLADDQTRDQAASWIRAEAFTAIVLHVLANQYLRTHLTAWLSRKPPIEKELDVRSVGYLLVVILRNTTGSDLDEWHARLVSDPVGTSREIRAKVDSARSSKRPTRKKAEASA